MARMLIIFGTTDGHTAKIATFMGGALRGTGASVTVVQPTGTAPSPASYDAVIVAASVHGGKFQQPVARWVQTHADALATKPSAFIAVCLEILQHEPAVEEEVHAIVTRFLTGAGWQAGSTLIVAGALPYTRYGWLKRWIMRRIVAKAGGDTDTSRDYEYTNWLALRAFCEQFGKRVELTADTPIAASA